MFEKGFFFTKFFFESFFFFSEACFFGKVSFFQKFFFLNSGSECFFLRNVFVSFTSFFSSRCFVLFSKVFSQGVLFFFVHDCILQSFFLFKKLFDCKKHVVVVCFQKFFFSIFSL